MKVFLRYFLVFITVLGPTGLSLAAENRRTNVAISGFENKTGTRDNDLYKDFTSETLLRLFVRTERFNVISRNALKKILQEKALNQTGVTDANNIQKLRQILHADFLIFGSILEVSAVRVSPKKIPAKTKSIVTKRDPKTNEPIAWQNIVVSKAKTLYPVTFQVKLLGKMIDTGTSEIIFAEEGEAKTTLETVSPDAANNLLKTKESTIKKLIQRSSVSMVAKIIAKVPIVGSIIKIEPKQVIVNIGISLGLFKKSNLLVYTTEKIGKTYISNKIAMLQVTEVQNDFSYAKMFDGEIKNLKKGMKVKVMPPQFKTSAMLPSIFIPGLGQILHERYWAGTSFFVGTGLSLGLGIAMLGGGLFEPSLNQRFDTVIVEDGRGLGANGQEQTGRVEEEIIGGHRIIAYALVTLGTLIYAWNIIDAGYPAERNTIFDQRVASLRSGQVIPVLNYERVGVANTSLDQFAFRERSHIREDFRWYAGVKILL